ncbi:MAG TPA: DMT family transporter [Chryseolinea sp.]|jgi:drug/metabolite transporter (DMT)-like permease|nr:DMT family transporter [Chryseolinea sp.]
MATRVDYFKLHFIVFLWGFSGILGKLILIPAYEMVFFRGILSALGIGIVMLMMRESFKVSRKQFINLIGIGFIVAIHWLAFFESARVSNVSVSLVGFATNSLWTAILEPLFNRTSVKKFELILGLVVIFGLYIIFSFDFQYPFGLFLGVLSGFTSAIFAILNSRMVKNISAYTISFYEMMGIFIGLGLFLPLYKTNWSVDGTLHLTPGIMDWVYMIILSGACSVYAYTTAVELMKKVSVFLIQLTLNLEPVYGIIMAVIIFGSSEKMGLSFYLGTLVIMCAVASYPLLRRRYDGGIIVNP